METLDEIKRHLRHGDHIRIAIGLCMTVENMRKTLQRPTATRYGAVVDAMRTQAEENIRLGISPVQVPTPATV
ncbi:hypothetical protein ACAW74_25960 [Fibrella sp. WM1]|uniref:hypothetical protein n=1 Tax=Fibrella musci TaxID=3242485 RepID=UPI00352186D4